VAALLSPSTPTPMATAFAGELEWPPMRGGEGRTAPLLARVAPLLSLGPMDAPTANSISHATPVGPLSRPPSSLLSQLLPVAVQTVHDASSASALASAWNEVGRPMPSWAACALALTSYVLCFARHVCSLSHTLPAPRSPFSGAGEPPRRGVPAACNRQGLRRPSVQGPVARRGTCRSAAD
jgi:hypothetical protein